MQHMPPGFQPGMHWNGQQMQHPNPSLQLSQAQNWQQNNAMPTNAVMSPMPPMPPMPQMPLFNNAFNPVLLQEFMRLSTPVGSYPNDDELLARAIIDGMKNGKTYRAAIEILHGVSQFQSFVGE